MNPRGISMLAGLVVLVGGTAGVLGCSKDRAADGMVTLTLGGSSGLEARVPAGTDANENAVGIGFMLTGPDVSMTVGPALSHDPRNLEQAKSNAQSYGPRSLEGEVLSDGYVLTYESDGSTGTIYWLVGRREFTNASYSCGVRSPKKSHQITGRGICKSLRK